jgi:hypothetical protein
MTTGLYYAGQKRKRSDTVLISNGVHNRHRPKSEHLIMAELTTLQLIEVVFHKLPTGERYPPSTAKFVWISPIDGDIRQLIEVKIDDSRDDMYSSISFYGSKLNKPDVTIECGAIESARSVRADRLCSWKDCEKLVMFSAQCKQSVPHLRRNISNFLCKEVARYVNVELPPFDKRTREEQRLYSAWYLVGQRDL